MEITAIVIPASQEAPIDLRKLDSEDLVAYQALVGGNVEPVDLDNPAASMYVNEEGKLLHLPINMRATHVAWAHNKLVRNEDIVMGDAFILGPVNQDGEDTSVPQTHIDRLVPTEPFRVEVLARGETTWAGNALLYDTWAQAYVAAYGLQQRWTLSRSYGLFPVPLPSSSDTRTDRKILADITSAITRLL